MLNYIINENRLNDLVLIFNFIFLNKPLKILGLIECAPNLFKQCKFYIENNNFKIVDIEYRLTKKGNPAKGT